MVHYDFFLLTKSLGHHRVLRLAYVLLSHETFITLRPVDTVLHLCIKPALQKTCLAEATSIQNFGLLLKNKNR